MGKLGVRTVAAHEVPVELAAHVPVRGVLAGAGDKAEILDAAAVVMGVGLIVHRVVPPW
jgi:hypothetical protein